MKTTKVDRCAVVASLLATQPEKSDELGRRITGELFDVFQRQEEKPVEPVEKEDVAEILRRRFFTPESVKDTGKYRKHVAAALHGVAELDEYTRKNLKTLEESFQKNYPFHPDIIDVFYTKWTNLQHFQRTRGVLRNFALAMRAAEKWDNCPLVGPNVFLSAPDTAELSDAAGDLCNIATREAEEGTGREWRPILRGELEKARKVQVEYSALSHRELEQAVFSIFIHSQPIGKKARTSELMRLVGPSRPDKIDIEKALQEWAGTSWFLDETVLSEIEGGSGKLPRIPNEWRLGPEPNLRQMHDEARRNVPEDIVDSRLLDEIGDEKSLTEGASAAGACVHKLPGHPRDIQDDSRFHFALLGPKSACDPGLPGGEVRRFIDETTGPDRPRVYRNAVLLAVPSKGGLEAARSAIHDYLAWEHVKDQLGRQEMGEVRERMLEEKRRESRQRIGRSIAQAYCIAVTVSEKNEIEAFKVTRNGGALFTAIKDDRRSRIKDAPVEAGALMPGGPYDLWVEDEESRRFQDLVGAFAQFPHLPKMLKTDEILETLIQGARDGLFVLRLVRPDRSIRTFWMEEPDEAARKDPGLEVVLPESAQLASIPPELLPPGALPQLWDGEQLKLGGLCKYFSGKNVVQVQRAGIEEPMVIPHAPREVVMEAVGAAVKRGKLWLTSESASLCGEDTPMDVLTDAAVLQIPPAPVPASDLLPENLPEAWEGGKTNAYVLADALSSKAETVLPWGTVRDVIERAVRSRELEFAEDCGPWPCEYEGAKAVKITRPSAPPKQKPLDMKPSARVGEKAAEAELDTGQIQDLADMVGELKKAAAGHEIRFSFRVTLVGEKEKGLDEEAKQKVNEVLKKISEKLQFD